MAGPINPHSEQKLLQPLDCGECEALFTEVLDHAEGIGRPLDSVQLMSFDAHVAGCAPCSGLLAEARRGHDWLRMLQREPVDPPTNLLSRILAQTSGKVSGQPSVKKSGVTPGSLAASMPTLPGQLFDFAAASAVEAPVAPKPVAPRTSKPWDRVNLVAMAGSARRNVSEPRFLLTAAMAFFSITLTLNLLGIHITQVRGADLKPGNLRRTVARSYSETTARVTRYYDNLRIVYELEARVREFRRNTDSLPEGGTRKPEAKPAGSSGPSSQRDDNTNRNDRLAGDPQNASPKRDEPEPARDAEIREVALRHPHALHNNSIENLKSNISCQRRFV